MITAEGKPRWCPLCKRQASTTTRGKFVTHGKGDNFKKPCINSGKRVGNAYHSIQELTQKEN